MTATQSEKNYDRSYSDGSDGEEVNPQQITPTGRRKTIIIRTLLWTLLGFAILTLSILLLQTTMAPIYSNLKSVLTLGLYFGLKSRNTPHTPSKTPGTTVAGIDTFVDGPVIDSNFADPCLIELKDGFHAFATNKFVKYHEGQVNIQYATSKNFDEWNLTTVDALPNAGPWASGDHIWAPDVIQLV